MKTIRFRVEDKIEEFLVEYSDLVLAVYNNVVTIAESEIQYETQEILEGIECSYNVSYYFD